MAQNRKLSGPPQTDGLIVPSKVGKTKEDWIGSQLQRIYNEALTEDIPDDMLSLLDQLDSVSDATGSSGGEGAK